MTNRKWLNIAFPKSQEKLKNSQERISWSDTDSESEEYPFKVDKLKTIQYKEVKLNGEDVSCCSLVSSTCNQGSQESPIISQLRNLSPILNEQRTKFETSIMRRKTITKKLDLEQENNFEHYENSRESHNSPDLFETQSTQRIDQDSPNSKSPVKIEPFLSQSSSQVLNYDSNSSSSKTDNTSLYHQPVNKCKRYKKGGLAFCLQRVLQLQKSRSAIWYHEIYTNKSDITTNLLEDGILDFSVIKASKEYGITLIECKSRTDSSIFESFLLVLGKNISLEFNINWHYKLFPPYIKKTVYYKSKNIVCYFNISRVLCCNN